MPVLPRWRHEIGEPVQKLKRCELDDAIGPRPHGLSAAAGPDPVGGFVPGKHVADAGNRTAIPARQITQTDAIELASECTETTPHPWGCR